MLDISIPGHEVLHLVGEGGMAQVWAGARLGAGGSLKPVAIKRIRPRLFSDPRFREMFLIEGRTTMLFGHGNIVNVFDVGSCGDELYMVMEWIDGVTLDHFARVLLTKRNEPLELSLVIAIVTQLLCALDYAHKFKYNKKKMGIIHRDVSPFNVMVTSSGEIKLMDFGVARVSGLHTTRSFKGNLSFMPKEQAQGDPRVESDLYAVGGVLYWLLEGKGFRSQHESEDTLMQAIYDGTVPPMKRPDVPDGLRRLVYELLAPDWRHRPHSARCPPTQALETGDRAHRLGPVLVGLGRTGAPEDQGPVRVGPLRRVCKTRRQGCRRRDPPTGQALRGRSAVLLPTPGGMIALGPILRTVMTMATRTIVVMGSGLVVGLAAYGCRFTELDPLHCTNNDGDAYCAQQFPDGSRPHCELGSSGCLSDDSRLGCLAERPTDECYSPCGGRLPLAEDATCIEAEESSSGSESSDSGTTDMGETDTDPSTTTAGPTSCVGNEDCTDASAPLCDPMSGECVSCGGVPDGACAELDPAAPLCLEDQCVQCTAAVPDACTGVTPVCDEATNTCVPCTEHGQCGDAACNLFTGACLPVDAVVRVGSGLDYETLGEAIASFAAEAEGTIIVTGNGAYDETVVVDGGRTLALLANDGDLPRWILSGGGSPQLTVVDGTVLMDAVQISGNASTMDPGLLVDGGRTWVDRGRIVVNQGGAIVAQNTAELVLRNCFVGGVIDTTVLDVQGATANVLYSTLGASLGNTRALACDAPSTVAVRNSLVVSRDAEAETMCPSLDASYTAAETLLDGEGNVALGDMDTMWFSDFNAGDFHLTTAPFSISSTAEWRTGDPATDIDGDARPSTDGDMDAAGADAPP